jgi:5'(3')-deoxyribonucleotidase
MAFDCTYQALPTSSDVLHLASTDSEFSENVFFWLIRNSHSIEKSSYYAQKDHDPIRKLFSSNPEIKELRYAPSTRKYDALFYTLAPELFELTYDELVESHPFKVVKGERIFSEHLCGTQGVPVRCSDESFINDCVKYLESYEIEKLLKNFNLNKHENRVSDGRNFTDFEPLKNYFLELLAFYRKAQATKGLTVFVVED